MRSIKRIERQLVKLQRRIARGRIKDRVKIERRIGAILARSPQVADLYQVKLEKRAAAQTLSWEQAEAKMTWARLREGSYLLRTDLKSEMPEALWEKYMQLVEVEASFRAFKSELAVRPIWHHKRSRAQAHILVAFLGYALWVTLKHTLKRTGLPLSCMKALHLMGRIQSGDILLETTDGRKLRLRRISRPDQESKNLLNGLGIALPERLNLDMECSADLKTST
jgi:transposase